MPIIACIIVQVIRTFVVTRRSSSTRVGGKTINVLIRHNVMLITVIIPKLLRITKSEMIRALNPPITVSPDATIALPILFVND
jgi:hypothetical protein